MSEKFFYNKFFNSINDLHDIIELEQLPGSIGPNGKRLSDNWTTNMAFANYFVMVYIKYIHLVRNVEDSYDQLIHPQIRKMIKKFLENLLCRLVKIKTELCRYNNPFLDLQPIHYVFLDDYLIDMKLEPDALDIVIPKYFREDNSEAMVKRRLFIEEVLKKKDGKAIPEMDIDRTKFNFHVDMTVEDAVRLLQNFEIGRQDLKRISKGLKLATKKVESEIGSDKVLVGDEKKKLVMEHLIAVQKIKQARDDELKFLKMKPSSKDEASCVVALNSAGTNTTAEDASFNVLPSPAENRNNRKTLQALQEVEYAQYKNEQELDIKITQGYELKQKMINERRDWMEKFKLDNKGEPPQQLKLFYEKDDITKKVELDENQKKEKDKILKDKLKKEQDKKKKDEQGDKIKVTPYAGPKGPEWTNIQNLIGEFKKTFETPSEYISRKDEFIQDLARSEVIDGIEATIQKEVDEMIEQEIRNRRTIFLKGKRDNIKKLPKPKPPPEKFITGEKALAKLPLLDIFGDLIEKGIVRKMVPKDLDDLLCDFNYIAHSQNLVDESLVDVPLFYTKQLIKEYCIYPMGSQFNKSTIVPNTPAVLFHGAPGTGKTHAAIAVAYHTDSLFIDISPKNLEGKIITKDETTKLVASVFRIAKYFQPVVIYFDHAEEIFVNLKKKGAVKNPTAIKLKRYLLSLKNLITQDMRVLIIGCTNKGWTMSENDVRGMFDKRFYFTLPSYLDRVKIWKSQITKKIGRLYDLEYDALAQISNGYSAEAIIECINYTLSTQRLSRVKFNPIQTEEFISSLSKTNYFDSIEYGLNREFLEFASGLRDLHDFLKKKREDNEKTNKKK